MQRIGHATHATWITACILLGMAATSIDALAHAQESDRPSPPAEERSDESERWRARIDELESRIESLLIRIENLEAMLTERTEQHSDAEAHDAVPPSKGFSDRKRRNESALHSPETIERLMQADFQDDLLRDPSFVLGIDSPNMRARDEAARVLGNWVEKSARSFRKPVSWKVRTTESVKQPDGDTRFEFEVIQPDGKIDSKTLEVIVPSRFERRIQGWREKEGFEGLTLKGFVEPVVRLIPEVSTEDLRTQVVFEGETYVALNEWTEVRFDFRLSSVTPRFPETPEPLEGDRKGGSSNEL